MRLGRKLERWTAAGLITADQAAAILRAEESEAGRPGGKWVVWALASVGGLAVVAGVISLVAANWDDIPDKVKLAGGLTALLALALSAREVGGRGDGWIRDLLLLVHQGMALAMIGLVAQVYHLSGHPWRAMALAAALAAPAAAAGRRALLGDVVLYFALQSLWFFLDEVDVINRLFETRQMAFLAVAIGLALAAARPWLGLYARVAQRWSIGLVGLTLVAAAALWSIKEREWGSSSERYAGVGRLALHWPFALFAMAALAAGAVQVWKRRRRDPATYAAALLAAVMLVGAVYPPHWEDLPRKIAGFALCCGAAVAFTFAAGARGSRAGVNVGTLALAARILILFLELFDDLTQTGVGLIITGLLLVGMAYGWWRLRVLVPVVGGGGGGRGEGDKPDAGASS